MKDNLTTASSAAPIEFKRDALHEMLAMLPPQGAINPRKITITVNEYLRDGEIVIMVKTEAQVQHLKKIFEQPPTEKET